MKKKELECVLRMVDLGAYEDFTEYLLENKLIDPQELVVVPTKIDKAKLVLSTLNDAAESGKLLLLDFEWTYLPIELIKITCVTENEKHEFTHGH